MSKRRRIAKELLWFICTIVGDFLAWSIFLYITEPKASTIAEGWEEVFEYPKVFLIVISPVAFIYAVRLTVWAIKELRRP